MGARVSPAGKGRLTSRADVTVSPAGPASPSARTRRPTSRGSSPARRRPPMRGLPSAPRRTGPAMRSLPCARGSIRLATMVPSPRRRPLTATRSPTAKVLAPFRPAVDTLWPSTVRRARPTASMGPTTSLVTAMARVERAPSAPRATTRTTCPTLRSAVRAGAPSMLTLTSGG